MMEKQITIERSAHRHEWGLAIRDKLGITLSWASLNARVVVAGLVVYGLVMLTSEMPVRDESDADADAD